MVICGWGSHFLMGGRPGTACSEEVIESIRNQSGHREGHKNVLWNQEGRKMFHRAGRRVDLRKVYLRSSS